MADSASQKAHIVEENLKYSNMINRTTSESIRLSESDKISLHPTTLTASSTIPKKKTSFQITSVTEGGHTSNDGGEDSADDLDESHAEDISDVIDNSRTDLENETPSYSEDTFSKDDVFFNSSTSLGTAPVIPTSSQYGLAIVSTPEGCGNILNANISGVNSAPGNDLHVNVSLTDNVINLGIVSGKHLEGDMRDLHTHTSRNERFKVVKIESTEPFKRGRWMCMDYLDHTMNQQNQQQNQGTGTNANINKVADSNDPSNLNPCTNADSGISVSDHPTSATNTEEHSTNTTDQSVNTGNSSSVTGQDQQNLASHSVAAVCGQNSISPGQTMQFNTQGGNLNHTVMNVSQSQAMQQGQSLTSAVTNQHSQISSNQHQSLQPQQIQQVISATNLHGQPASLGNQQIQQPIQQMQHQGLTIQQVHQIQQAQTAANMVPQQQYQQTNPQLQQIHHQQPSLQPVQQPSTMLQQQPTIPQHLQHQHNMAMPLQQQLNQGQIPVQVIANQANIQQIPQQAAQMSVHSQMQQIQQNLLQHLQNVAAVAPMSLSGVVNSGSQVIQPQTSQQYHLPTSQSMIQQGIQSQPGLMSLPQTQYYTNSQMQNAMSVQQPISNNTVLQAQANSAMTMQQNYPVTSINQQQPQQISVGHAIPPSSMPHISQTQIPTSSASVIMSQPNPLSGINNLTIPATQNTVISPQANSQGATLVQHQYVTQPVVSSLPQTQTSVGSQVFVSSTMNTGLPSNIENIGLQGYPVEIPTDQTGTAYQTNQPIESQSDSAITGEETQPEDSESFRGLALALATSSFASTTDVGLEVDTPAYKILDSNKFSASGASAVAIDNKIEQAMDLVKSHLMFAVREEVEVLKEKISELMEKINLLETENSILRQHATQETLAQLTSMQPPTSSLP